MAHANAVPLSSVQDKLAVSLTVKVNAAVVWLVGEEVGDVMTILTVGRVRSTVQLYFAGTETLPA